ncbi:MAG: MBOAT family protein [Crocinitomicaceae bacterium]|nr:MBOAT family protein [Crocinitomicaceae bacterium]
MLFSSLVFLFNFLPLLLLTYFISPRNTKNAILLLFSLLFYAWGGFSYTLILILSVLANWLISLKINEDKNKKWLLFGLVLNVLVLVIFKYLNFFIDNINVLIDPFSNQRINNVKIHLPLGISFFTFQQMSMLWDIYRSKEKTKIRLLDSALYVSFFPQLIAGPIVRYHDIIDQIKNRVVQIDLINSGIKRFIYGLFKKVVIANTCAQIADDIMANNIHSIGWDGAWLGILAYTFQIFFDFSGYSDMAIGLGRIFGFRILENFNFPYISRSIQEFWRRWHISLSNWFKDYVYIPLGGNRKSKNRTYFNLILVFLLTGFWHGATWSFVFWGLFHGFFLIIERIGFKKILDRIPSIFSWVYTFLIVVIGWVFFRIEGIEVAFEYVSTMFHFGNGFGHSLIYFNSYNVAILILALFMCSPLIEKYLEKKIKSLQSVISIEFVPHLVSSIFFLSIFFYTCLVLATSSYNPFIYFRF